MLLVDALAPSPAARIAFVGAGGKTTTLFHLAHSLPGTVWVTTTTHLEVRQAQLADQHFIIDSPEELASPLLWSKKVTLVTGLLGIDYRLHGPDEPVLEEMKRLAKKKGFFLLVEADGARQLALKAPAEHEPSIPPWIDTVIVCAGLSALGKPLSSDRVHRQEHYAALSGLMPGEIITPAAAIEVLLHPQGGLKAIPSAARRIALLNQVDTAEILAQAREIAGSLLAGGYDGVFIASMKEKPEDGVWLPKQA